MNAWAQTPFFGISLTIFAFWIGVKLYKRQKVAILNSIMIAVIIILLVLKILGISLDSYFVGADLIHLMLGPATTCMAISIYNKRELLKKNLLPVLAGCVAGVLASVVSIVAMSRLFGLDQTMMMSLIPKSVTTPIATAISGAQGGIVSITVAAVIVTGVFGNMAGPFLCRIFRITDPIAQGVAYGTAAHVIGTARARQHSEVAGAVSSLSLVVAGILTAVIFPIFL